MRIYDKEVAFAKMFGANKKYIEQAIPHIACLRKESAPEVIDHAEAYVRGRVHTNGIENFWSLLKRAIKGTYVSVEPFHLFRYLDEEALRFNTRKVSDSMRFSNVIRAVIERGLTYRALTGTIGPT